MGTERIPVCQRNFKAIFFRTRLASVASSRRLVPPMLLYHRVIGEGSRIVVYLYYNAYFLGSKQYGIYEFIFPYFYILWCRIVKSLISRDILIQTIFFCGIIFTMVLDNAIFTCSRFTCKLISLKYKRIMLQLVHTVPYLSICIIIK